MFRNTSTCAGYCYGETCFSRQATPYLRGCNNPGSYVGYVYVGSDGSIQPDTCNYS